jgi:hypothetical protein
MPTTYVEYLHDDGRWMLARLVQQVRSGPDRRWRVLVTYSTAPGFTFTRGEWADSDRLAPVGTHEPHSWTADDLPAELAAAMQRSQLRY